MPIPTTGPEIAKAFTSSLTPSNLGKTLTDLGHSFVNDTISSALSSNLNFDNLTDFASSTAKGIPIPGSDSYFNIGPFADFTPKLSNVRMPFIPPLKPISIDDLGVDIDMVYDMGIQSTVTTGTKTGSFNLPSVSYTPIPLEFYDDGFNRVNGGIEVGYQPKLVIGDAATNKTIGIKVGFKGDIATKIQSEPTIETSGEPYATIDDDITGFGLEHEVALKLKLGVEVGPKLPGSESYLPEDGCKASIVAGGLELTTPLTVGLYTDKQNTLTLESKISPYGDIGALACGDYSVTAIPLAFSEPIVQLLPKQTINI
ncbi:hypothetical protein [Synechococcus sp. KORDI-100]|uniref:hypothetical protein n=1 Tax=Synechococcus sp. KORDI-100 TaxID=1280380 RepID=UPI000AB23C57|nr:hypothetical protein [Synechococcus sp. KORDI-100]